MGPYESIEHEGESKQVKAFERPAWSGVQQQAQERIHEKTHKMARSLSLCHWHVFIEHFDLLPILLPSLSLIYKFFCLEEPTQPLGLW